MDVRGSHLAPLARPRGLRAHDEHVTGSHSKEERQGPKWRVIHIAPNGAGSGMSTRTASKSTTTFFHLPLQLFHMGLLKVISNLTARPGTIPSTSAFFFTLGSTAWSNFSTVSRVQESSGIDEPFCLKYRRPCSSFAPSSKTTTLWISNTSSGPILGQAPGIPHTAPLSGGVSAFRPQQW